MKKLLTFLMALFLWFSAQAESTPKDTLKACYDNYLQFNVAAQNDENSALMRITNKVSYFRFGLVGFNMSAVSAVREKVELGFFVYSSTADDFFTSAQAEYPLGVYALKRKPTLPTSYGLFFGSPTAVPPGDGFTLTGSLPKVPAAADAELIGTVVVQKSNKETFVRYDVTDYLNKHINGNDSVFFFLASTSKTTDLGSLYIKTVESGQLSSPRLFLYNEKPVALMQGGRQLFAGEKDRVKVFFPPTATPPFSITYTDGAKPVTVNNIQNRDYSFEVAPVSSVTYMLTAASDANGAIAVDGSAKYTVLAPNATLSGVNKIYKGEKCTLTVDFGGVAPYSFSYTDHTGATVTKSGITTPVYQFEVSPTATYTYVLTSASDANNATIAVSGSVTVTVIDVPQPVLSAGAENWSVIFGEEFGTGTLDESRWNVVKGSPEVVNDELRLKVTREGTSNVASQVKLLDKLPNNGDFYLEARIRPLNAQGVNSSFSTQTYDTKYSSKYENRYGMSFPVMERRADQVYDILYALEDWKTSYYIKEIDPDLSFNGMTAKIENITISDYKVFGMSVTRDDIVYYIDGVEVKRASNMAGYNSSSFIDMLTATGSAYEDVAQKGYGYYGQDDWKYNGGYTGDYMALLLGVALKEAEVDASVVGKYASVDYFRIFKPKADIVASPVENITFDDSTPVSFTGTAAKTGKSISMKDGAAMFSLKNEIDLNSDGRRYFSTIIRKSEDADFILSLCKADGTVLTGSAVDNYNQLQTGFGSSRINYASTVSAEPVGRKPSYYKNDEAYLMVGRLETSADGDDYMSLSLFPVMDNIQEPYFYANIEGDYGHASLNNDWDLNYKFETGNHKVTQVKMESKRAQAFTQKFLLGTSFNSVIPQESFASFVPGLDYISIGESAEMTVQLKGTAPWTLTYSDGKTQHTLENITTPTVKIEVAPTVTTKYTLLSLTDGEGREGIVFGEHVVRVKSADAMTLYPMFDTYVRADQPSVVYCNDLNGQIKKDATFTREAFLRYDISEYGKNDSIGVASFSMFFIANDKGAPVVLSLSSVEGGMPGDLEDLCWANRPDDVNVKFLSEITVPNPGFSGVRSSWDITKFINKKLRSGAGTVDFHVKLTGGETSSLMSWRQYRADTLQLAHQFPMLDMDPYNPNGISTTEADANVKLILYPNPMTGSQFRINVEADGAVASIYTLNGMLVRETVVENDLVQADGLVAGTYIVRLVAGDRLYHSMLLVK